MPPALASILTDTRSTARATLEQISVLGCGAVDALPAARWEPDRALGERWDLLVEKEDPSGVVEVGEVLHSVNECALVAEAELYV
jgi:hypothetical protein